MFGGFGKQNNQNNDDGAESINNNNNNNNDHHHHNNSNTTTLALPMRWLPTPWARHLLLVIGQRLSPCLFGLLCSYLCKYSKECDGINFDHWHVFFIITRDAEIERRRLQLELDNKVEQYLRKNNVSSTSLNNNNNNKTINVSKYIDPLRVWMMVARETYYITKEQHILENSILYGSGSSTTS